MPDSARGTRLSRRALIDRLWEGRAGFAEEGLTGDSANTAAPVLGRMGEPPVETAGPFDRRETDDELIMASEWLDARAGGSLSPPPDEPSGETIRRSGSGRNQQFQLRKSLVRVP